jgi:hypothetical protein
MIARIHKSLVVFAAAFGLAATAAPAAAGPITVTFEQVNPGLGSAGQYNWNTGSTAIDGILYTPMTNGSSSANHFITFCIQQNQYISGGTTYSDYTFANLENAPVPGTPMSATAADALRQMWAEFRDDLDTGSATDKNNKSAAFQNAVWHLVSGYNPSLSGAELTDYNTFLNPNNWHSGFANLAAIVSQEHQDQILELKSGYVVDPNGNLVATPAPATLAVALLIAPALVLVYRRSAVRVA